MEFPLVFDKLFLTFEDLILFFIGFFSAFRLKVFSFVFLLRSTLTKMAPVQRMGTIDEKRKMELNKVAEKQRLSSKEEMDYLLERLDAKNSGHTILSDLKYSLKEKETKIAMLEQQIKAPVNSWLNGNAWLDRIITSSFSIVAILCLLKGVGFIQSDKTPLGT